MRIECPSCFAAYVVPDSLVTTGRVVRCARCGGDWTPVAAETAPAPEAEVPERLLPEPPPEPPPAPTAAKEPEAEQVVAATRPSAMERLAAHPAWPRSSSTRLRLAWAASLLLLALAIGAAFTWRGEVVAAWPPSARAYALFGLQPQTETP